MNILLFTHHLSQGGAEKTVRTLSEYLNDHYPDVSCYICVVYDAPELKNYPRNVIVMEHRSRREDSKCKKAVNVLAQIREMKEIKRRYQIDVCVSFLAGADIINVLSGTGEKQIVSVRNIQSHFAHNIFQKIYRQTAYKKCDYIVACSETVRHDCISNFHVPENKIGTILNAASPLKLTGETISSFADFRKTHHVILNVGRLEPEKGQMYLIRAFAEFIKNFPVQQDGKRPGLVFLGEGGLFEILQNALNKLHISQDVLFCGNQPNPSDYMQQADMFVLSSNVEGMPNVLLEALQNGLPCIATECGAREILAPKTDPIKDRTDGIDCAEYGILVPVCGSETSRNDIEDMDIMSELRPEEKILSRAIKQLYSDEELKMQYRMRSEKAVSRLTMENISSQWMQVIRKTMQEIR